MLLKTKKNLGKHFDVESIIGGKTGVLKGVDKEYKIEVKGIPECTKSCPAGVNVKAYIHLIANRKFEEAIETIRQTNPFPAVCGRVCTKPCEENCELGANGDSISIRSLKRYASDYELARRSLVAESCKIIYDEQIAIIGAGPAGLTAAVDLINIGYPVTVFEEKKDTGGMLRYGIPSYRLPKRILKREIDWIKGLGVEIKTDVKIKDPASLFKKGFSAVLIAGGAHKSFPLGLEGDKEKSVIDALLFLREINTNNPKDIKGNIVVVGGGSTAFDAARSAIRLGAKKVTLAYRRGIKEMPAETEEIEAAKEENVEILTLAIPKKIVVKENKVIGIEFFRAELGEPDESGRRKPLPTKDSEFIVKADFIISAVGAMPDVGLIGGVKVTTPKGVIEVSENGKTVVEGVFAAGDVEMGPSSVVDAIGRGHEAARGVDAYLRGTVIPKKEELIKGIQIYLESPISHSVKPSRLTLGGKSTTFDEVKCSYTDFEAVEEATRCFTCGPCYMCPVCLPNCKNKQLIAEIDKTTFLVKAPPSLSQEITEKGPSTFKLKSQDNAVRSLKLYGLTSYVDPDLCIGCGRCEEVCAYRAIKNILIKDERPISQVAHDSCASCSACVSECPSGAISQGYMSDSEILSRLAEKKTPYDGIKALMSYWSTPSPVIGAYDGVVELMSGRKPSPSFLIRALARSGRGILVIKPDEITGSHYLPWEEEPQEIVQRTWNLLKLVGISTDRIRYISLPKDGEPSTLLKDFSQYLDEKKLGKLTVPIPTFIKSPIGEAMIILRILGANPDTKYSDEYISTPPVKLGDNVFFEGCLPILHAIGKAHKLFDLGPTRFAIRKLIEKIKINCGFIEGLSCPSKGLLHIKADGMKEIVSKIEYNNNKAFKRANPEKIITGTPEAFLTFSKEKKFSKVSSFPEELIKSIKEIKNLTPINKTVAIHHACTIENDPFYETIKKLLELIPKVKIVDLEKKCGHSEFEKLNGNSKQSAIDLMNEATEKGAEVILCTSPYCESHLLISQREGSWHSADITITDIYRFLLSSITGDM